MSTTKYIVNNGQDQTIGDWSFGATGLTFPDNSVQTTAYTGGITGPTGPTGANGPALFTFTSTDLSKIEFPTANSIVKIDPSGAATIETVETYVYAFVTAKLTTTPTNAQYLGLTDGATPYRFQFFPGGTLYALVDNNPGVNIGTWTNGDIYSVVATPNGIQFMKNGIVLHTEPYVPTSYKGFFVLNELGDGFNTISFGYILPGAQGPTGAAGSASNTGATGPTGSTGPAATLYLLEATTANITYTLPGSFTEDPCRYSIVSNTVNVSSSWFDTTGYTFTPQKAGYWEITAAYDVYRNSESAMVIKKNNGIIATAGSFGAVAQQITKIVYLNGSTDFINIVNVGGAANSRDQYAERSWFQARWIGE